MIATDSTRVPDANEVLSQLAQAINPMLEGAVDEAKVREIATEEVAKARLPRPIEVHQPDGQVVKLDDEVDAADGNVMVSINAALANGMMCNPVTGEVIERHADCLIVTAANTYGRGGDMVYVGRNALDGATLDRFVLAKLFVNYDTDLEEALAAALDAAVASELLTWVTMLRNRIAEFRLRRIASTRLVEQAVRTLAAGKALADVKARYFQDWSKDELAKVSEEVR